MNVQFFNPPVFYYSGVHYNMLPPINLPTLCAWFNLRGHHAEGVDLEAIGVSPEQFGQKMLAGKDRWPDVIGFTALTISKRGLRECLQELRKVGYDKKVVVGGVWPTLHPEMPLEWGADLVITGECEGNVIDLITSGATGVHAGVPADIADIPVPDWRYWRPHITSYESNIKRILFPNPGISMWTRGCPYSCIFCANTIFGGRATRYRPPYMVEADMLALKAQGCERIYVYDDELVGTKLPEGWMADVADRIAPYGFSWVTQGRCSKKHITTELMRDVKRAGCRAVFWGVESFSERILKSVHKGIHTDDIMHTLRASHDAGIENAVFTMIGNYGETDEDREITCQGLKAAYDEGLIQMRQTTICTPMEGTRLAELATAEGWYSEAPDFGPQMLQHEATPWLPADRADYWMRRYWEACPVLI